MYHKAQITFYFQREGNYDLLLKNFNKALKKKWSWFPTILILLEKNPYVTVQGFREFRYECRELLAELETKEEFIKFIEILARELLIANYLGEGVIEFSYQYCRCNSFWFFFDGVIPWDQEIVKSEQEELLKNIAEYVTKLNIILDELGVVKTVQLTDKLINTLFPYLSKNCYDLLRNKYKQFVRPLEDVRCDCYIELFLDKYGRFDIEDEWPLIVKEHFKELLTELRFPEQVIYKEENENFPYDTHYIHSPPYRWNDKESWKKYLDLFSQALFKSEYQGTGVLIQKYESGYEERTDFRIC